MIDANDMVAYWSVNDSANVTEFIIDSRLNPTLETEHLRFCAGAVSIGWMSASKGGEPSRTPIELYTELSIHYGFASIEIHAEVVRQFCKVRGQDWAARHKFNPQREAALADMARKEATA